MVGGSEVKSMQSLEGKGECNGRSIDLSGSLGGSDISLRHVGAPREKELQRVWRVMAILHFVDLLRRSTLL